jgi:hypothetical protein
MKKPYLLPIIVAAALQTTPCRAWDYEGHRVVNELALASLPTNFPAFALTPEARERIAFLAGEPDRWRNTSDLTLKHFNGPDHYIDLEELADYGLDAHSLPKFRYEFTAELALARHDHPDHFAPIDPDTDADHTRELVGFLPWAIVENYDKLKSGFSYLKAFEQSGGTTDEITNAQENILYIMGVMGHYVGDGSQPLHTTKYFNGWTGENTNHYTTSRRFHAWIDGGYFQRVGVPQAKDLAAGIHPAELISAGVPEGQPADTFTLVMEYLLVQNKLVEPLYQLEKDGKLSGEGPSGRDGLAFLEKQLAAGAQMLGNLWFTAWREATPDTYLAAQLARRAEAAESAGTAK